MQPNKNQPTDKPAAPAALNAPANSTDVADDEIANRRKAVREEFLNAIGWSHVKMHGLQADASFRRYYRLEGTDAPMLLMQDPPDRPAIPPFVMVAPFINISEHLRELGLRAPTIHFKDLENGLLILEDFGDDTYTQLFNKGQDPKPLYELAVDALVHLHKHPQRNDIDLPPYDDKHLVDEAMLLLDWYLPSLTGQKPTQEMKESFAQVWRDLFAQMPKDQQTMVLRDYHVDNLMLASDGQGIEKCGLLDFQDALIGQFSYDLMSLLEDARRDVPKDLKKHLYDRYLDGMGSDLDRAGFDYSFRVLAAQRHAKVLGIFVRLHERDGKERYLQFIPHVQKLFINAVNDPALTPLKKWFDEHKVDITLPLKASEKPKGPTP